MTNRKFVISMVLLLAVGSIIFAAGEQESSTEDHFVIQNIAGEASYFEKSMPEMAKMDLEGWAVQNLKAADIDFYIFDVAPNAVEMGIHASPAAWIGYILSGSGELSLGDADGNEIEAVTFTKGDYLIFEPDAMHGWRAGEKGTTILFVTKLN